MNKSGIYCIKNMVNGKQYVGSAINLRSRFNAHRHKLRSGTHANRVLQSAWKKYGEEAFLFDTLEFVEIKELLTEREQSVIDSLKTVAPGGYNLRKIASSNLGLPCTEERRAKASASMMGKKNPKSGAARKGKRLSPEHVERAAAANRGQKRSPETKAKLSACAKGHRRWVGRHHSEETKAKLAAVKTGGTWTAEQRIKCVAARYNISDETRRKMSEAARGRVDPPETRANKSAALMGRVLSAESRAKISASLKARNAGDRSL